jgi:hypothetical protein
MSRFPIQVNTGTRSWPYYNQIYNQNGNNYMFSIDKNKNTGIFYKNDTEWIYSHDDRLWPIYISNELKYLRRFKDKYITVPGVCMYFQLKDNMIYIMRVKDATVEEVYRFVPKKTIEEQILIYKNEDASQAFMLSMGANDHRKIRFDVKKELSIEGKQYFYNETVHQTMKFYYKKTSKSMALTVKSILYDLEHFISPGLRFFPVIIETKNEMVFEQAKFEIDWWDKTKNNWNNVPDHGFWHIPNLLNTFKDDFLYFQVDEYGMLQIFHGKSNEKKHFTFTGSVFDLNFSPPFKIFLDNIDPLVTLKSLALFKQFSVYKPNAITADQPRRQHPQGSLLTLRKAGAVNRWERLTHKVAALCDTGPAHHPQPPVRRLVEPGQPHQSHAPVHRAVV